MKLITIKCKFGAKGSGCFGPFQILSPKAQAEEENVQG